jgi:hypothetical protein
VQDWEVQARITPGGLVQPVFMDEEAFVALDTVDLLETMKARGINFDYYIIGYGRQDTPPAISPGASRRTSPRAPAG